MIVVNLDVVMAQRKMTLSQLAEKVDITLANLSILKNNKARAVRFSTLAAICAAPTILANMGFLDRRRAVCYPGMEELMGSAVVQKGTPVVVDGHIVTAEAAGSAFPFGLKLVEVLKGAEAARQVAHAVHYHG